MFTSSITRCLRSHRGRTDWVIDSIYYLLSTHILLYRLLLVALVAVPVMLVLPDNFNGLIYCTLDYRRGDCFYCNNEVGKYVVSNKYRRTKDKDGGYY